MAKLQADHVNRGLEKAKLMVSGNVTQFIFPDGSVTTIQAEEGEIVTGTIYHYEKALRYIEWLRDNGIMTVSEHKRVDDRIMRMAKNIKQE